MQSVEKAIIDLLREDSRLTCGQLAAAAGITEEEARKTVRSLEERGLIVKYTAIVNSEEIEEDGVEALIEVKVTPGRGSGFDSTAREIAAHSEVISLYLMSGAYDFAVIVRAKSLREVSRFVSEKISTYGSVISTATHFILKRYKVEGAQMSPPEGGARLSVQA